MITCLELMRCAMGSSAAIHIVSPAEFDSGTAQTPGSERLAAVAPTLGMTQLNNQIVREILRLDSARPSGAACWTWNRERGRAFIITESKRRSPTSLLGSKGRLSRARTGRRFRSRPRLPAAHGNQSFEVGAFRWVVVQSTATPIVVNLPDEIWP
jgi:hypothetical protein